MSDPAPDTTTTADTEPKPTTTAVAWSPPAPDPAPAGRDRASARQVASIRAVTRKFHREHPTEAEARALSRNVADKVIQELTALERRAGIAAPAQPSIAAALPATVRTTPTPRTLGNGERAARVSGCPHPAADRATDGPFCNRCGETVTA